MTVQDRLTKNPRDVSSPAARGAAWYSPARLNSLGSAALAGGVAALVGWVIIAVPVLAAWFADPLSTVSAGQALGTAAGGWALAHRGVIDAAEVSVQLTPLLLTAILVLLCRCAARRVLIDDVVAVRSPPVKKLRTAWRGVRGNELTVFVASYVLVGLVICLGSELSATGASFALALPGLILTPAAGIALALAREHRREENPTIARALRWLTQQIPVLARRGLAPAGEALVGLGVGSLLIVVVLISMRGARVEALYAALDAGPVGVAVLTLGQLLMLPNLMVWALGWVSGAGMSMGTVHVGWERTTSGDLPLIPMLAALPDPGAMPSWAWLIVIFPMCIGAWLGFRSARSAPRLASWWTKARVALSSCAWVGVAVLTMSWLATGSLTPGRLGTIGTEPLLATGALLAQLLAGALLVVTAMHVLRRRL